MTPTQKRNSTVGALLLLLVGMVVWVAVYPTLNTTLPLWFFVTGIAGVLAGNQTVLRLRQAKGQTREATVSPSAFSRMHPELIEQLEKSPQLLEFAPNTKSITVVHVEIVAFNDMLRRFSPEQNFHHLQKTYDHASQTVSRFGGLMLPGYRGGFLFAFGDILGVKLFRSSHADRALFCAHAMQLETASRLSQLVGQEGPAFSLRIGIVTAQTFVANLGDRSRFDLVLLGDAILEAETISRTGSIGGVTVSELTIDLAETLSRTSHLVKERQITLPGDVEGIFYDLEVFADQESLRSAMVESVKQAAAVRRREARFEVGDMAEVQVMSDIGPVKLLNISRTGLGIFCQPPLEKGQMVQLSITTSSERINSKLKARGVSTFSAEVVFIAADQRQFGLIHKSVPNRDRDFLLHSVLEASGNV